jgi:MoaA/NifB/PqqE/SkfB family radical SAM enzyme
MLDQVRGFHIELTNMCTLKCPECARTDFINKFPKQWANKNLNLDHLINFLDVDLTDKTITLCGNYGDAIYYDRLFEAVSYFKKSKAKLVIATNGSYKNKEWWQELGSLLDSQDEIVFAIDGLPSTFTEYRINADWSSISVAVETLKFAKVQLSWKYILFSFNEDSIDQARQLSKDMGFDNFIMVHSNRWDDILEPLSPSISKPINVAKLDWKQNKILPAIDPKCKQAGNEHYISADGFYMPCCYVGDHRFYYKSEFYKNQSHYDISKTTISKLLSSDRSINFYSSLEDAKLNYCTFNCPKL